MAQTYRGYIPGTNTKHIIYQSAGVSRQTFYHTASTAFALLQTPIRTIPGTLSIGFLSLPLPRRIILLLHDHSRHLRLPIRKHFLLIRRIHLPNKRYFRRQPLLEWFGDEEAVNVKPAGEG